MDIWHNESTKLFVAWILVTRNLADIVFSLQVFINMASMIDDEVTWMSKMSFENVTRIKSFRI